MNSERSDKSIVVVRIISECPDNLPIIRDAIVLFGELVHPIEIVLQESLVERDYAEIENIHGEFLGNRLLDPSRRDARAIDSFALRDFEKRVLLGKARARGVPYEGPGLRKLYQQMLEKKSAPPREISVIITDRMIMTWSEDDLRYHARVVVFGFPSIISISGLIEAPARPREYYAAKNALLSAGLGSDAEQLLSERFSGSYLEAEDDRIPAVLRGYLLQCLFYAHSMEPFCESDKCMLCNAHWQEEMIRAQLEHGDLCKRHKESLRRIRDGEPVNWLTE